MGNLKRYAGSKSLIGSLPTLGNPKMREINFLNPQMQPDLVCLPDADGHCLTCSDDAPPARVLCLDLATQTALVVLEGAETEVDISLLELVSPGDTLLVHGGVALSNLGPLKSKAPAARPGQELIP